MKGIGDILQIEWVKETLVKPILKLCCMPSQSVFCSFPGSSQQSGQFNTRLNYKNKANFVFDSLVKEAKRRE